MFTLIFVTIASILSYGIYFTYRFHTYWERQGLKAMPVLEWLEWLFKPFHEVLIKNRQNYGKTFCAYGPFQRIVVYNDPKVFRDVSIKQMNEFPIRFYGYLGESSMVHSLFLMESNQDWKRIRSVVSPAFTSGKLKAMLTPIDRIVNNFIGHLEKYSANGERFDMKLLTSAFAMDVISSCAYGIDIDSLSQPNHPVVMHARRILSIDADISQMICYTLPFLGKLLRLNPFDKESCAFFDNLTFKVIEERLAQSNTQNKDMIGLMMEQMDKSSSESASSGSDNLKGISRQEIAGQGIIFFLAGYDTTNVTLCHIIFNLIKHPEWQEKLFQELEQQESLMDYELLRSLPILNAVINETLRLFPPLLVNQRTAKTDTMLADTGIRIPANTILCLEPYTVHRDPEYFPDPESFKPERFIGENSMENSVAFVPFGVGPRICVGMRFAQNELRVAIAQLILNYRLVPDPDLKLEYFKGNIIMSPKTVMIRIEKR